MTIKMIKMMSGVQRIAKSKQNKKSGKAKRQKC